MHSASQGLHRGRRKEVGGRSRHQAGDRGRRWCVHVRWCCRGSTVERKDECSPSKRALFRGESSYYATETKPADHALPLLLPLPPPSKRPAGIWNVCFHAASIARGASPASGVALGPTRPGC
eukprot:scaffold66034_cov66-Phaeocystis_antarctica.AAC.5